MVQELVIQQAVGFYPVLGQKFKNPFRTDSTAKCYFAWDKPRNYIRLYDWSNSFFHRMNCFDLIFYSKHGRKITGDKDLQEATDLIRDMTGDSISLNKADTSGFEFTLRVNPRELGDAELNYYSQYGITKDNLVEDKVSGVESYEYNLEQEPNLFYRYVPGDVCVALWRGERKKIYRPYNKLRKWKTDCTSQDIYWWNARESEYALILASHKDGRVAANWGYPTIAFQSETSIPENLDIIVGKHKKLLYIGDNDRPGLSNGQTLVDKLKHLPITHNPMPSYLLNYGIKDLAEFRRKGGTKEVFDGFLFSKD